MKVTDILAEKKDKTLVSFEILPPLKGKSIHGIYDVLDHLVEFKPSFINVTYHRSEYIYKKRGDDRFDKVFIRKRPGTESICAAIMNKYNVDTVPHLICGGFSVNETEDALINLRYLGIDNVLVLRGDAAKNETAFEKKLLKEDGWFILETSPRHDFTEHPKLLEVRNYGQTHFWFFGEDDDTITEEHGNSTEE